MSSIQTASPGRAFDVDQPLSAAQAATFKGAGYICAIRYVPRTAALKTGNLTATETNIILEAGLNLMVVQHVAEPGWEPTAILGTQYGAYGAAYAGGAGYRAGGTIWLDLEGVHTTSTPQAVVDYCKAWYTTVQRAGYIAGVYVGYDTLLSPYELWQMLPFSHYWNAYNGPGVSVRGCQVWQHSPQILNGISFDPDIIQYDNKGGLPSWLSPS